MTEELFERLVLSFERIAESLEKSSVIQQQRYDRDYPERKEPREAIVSRIKTEEDLAKERQGASTEPIKEWFGGFEDTEYIGVRERAFLEEQQRHAGATVQSEKGPNEGGAEAAGGQGRGRRKRTADNPTP